MSAVYTILLLILITVSTAVLLHLRGLSRRLDAQAAAQAAPVPVDQAAIRQAVTEALAADREREITEARAFWAEQEARAAEDAPLFDSPYTGPFASTDEWPLFFPRPTGPQDAVDNAGTMDPEFGEALRSALEDLINEGPAEPGPEGGSSPFPGQGAGASSAGTSSAASASTASTGSTEPTGDARARREADLLATGLEAGLLDADQAVEDAPVAAPDQRRHPSTPTSCPARRRPASGPTPGWPPSPTRPSP